MLTKVADVGRSRNLAICYNNIACIHAKKFNYAKQRLYFTEAIKIEESIVYHNNLVKNFTSREENFKLGCKYFNYGYSLYR